MQRRLLGLGQAYLAEGGCRAIEAGNQRRCFPFRPFKLIARNDDAFLADIQMSATELMMGRLVALDRSAGLAVDQQQVTRAKLVIV